MQILVYWWDWQRATDRVIEVSGRRRELVGYRCHWEDGAVRCSERALGIGTAQSKSSLRAARVA